MQGVSLSSVVSTLNPFSVLSNRNFSLNSTTRKLLGLVYVIGTIGSVVGAAQTKAGADAVVWKHRQTIHVNPITDEEMICQSLEINTRPINYVPDFEPSLRNIVACPAAFKVLKEVMDSGGLTILNGDYRTAPAGASWNPNYRLIAIQPTSNQARNLGQLLSTLTEALQDQRSFFDECKKGHVSREDYVLRMNQIQYNANKRFVSVVRDCIKNHQWPKAADPTTRQVYHPTWEKHWASLQLKPGYLDIYRRGWDAGIKKDYCPTHPKAPEC